MGIFQEIELIGFTKNRLLMINYNGTEILSAE